MKSIIKRATSKTPKFFNRLKIVGGVLVTTGITLLTGGVAVPVLIASYAGYMVAIGGTMVAVSQLVTPYEK